MTEDEARAWLIDVLDVSRETLDRLAAYAALVAAEQVSQNLVSARTLPAFWARHIVDSAQLVRIAMDRGSSADASWLDIGSGAGIPGIVTAILTGAPTLLVEPRARRAQFLRDAVEALGLARCRVAQCNLQRVETEPFDVITARAVAALPALIAMATRFARKETLWILPKGKNAKAELETLPHTWQGAWLTHASVTDPASFILIGRNIQARDKA